MREVLKAAASLSLSGSLVILVLFLLRPLLRERVSKRWQYYIWLVAVLRLLLPLSPEASPVGALFQAAETPAGDVPAIRASAPYPGLPAAGDAAAPSLSAPPEVPAASEPNPEAAAIRPPDPTEALALVWLGGALLLLVWKLTSYRSFSGCLGAGCREISDPALLDLLARTGERLGVRRPVELYENPLAASPLLLGLVRPRVVLPSAAVPEEDFRHIVLHELTHYRRRDPVYKWLVQLAVCLHWYNPLVWLMAREIDRACELACDEAVLRALEPEGRRAYGDTLLRALESGGGYRAAPGSVSLGESAELLKERLTAIMRFRKTSKRTALLSLLLAAALTTGAAAAGSYTGPAKRNAPPSPGRESPEASASARAASSENLRLRSTLLAEQCYEDGSLAGFSIAIPFLSEEAQRSWLERCYQDKHISFFNVCLSESRTWAEDSLLEQYAERAYQDRTLAFFSLLIKELAPDEEDLDAWIRRAEQDQRASFLATLLAEAGRDEDADKLEEQLEAQQMEEYKAVGITREGGVRRYQGKPVRIFLDLRPDASCVTLDMNPKGVLDIRVERGADGSIQSVREMTEAEAEELFGSLEDHDCPVTVPVKMDRLRENTWCWLGEYVLSEGDHIRWDVSAETGERLSIGFADMERKPDDVSYYTVSNRRENGVLRCTADFLFDGKTVKPGRYRLFLHAPGKLENVKGSVTLDLLEQAPVPPEPPEGPISLMKEEAPAAVRAAMERCAPQTWYLIHSEGRKYLWYDGFPQRWFYAPVWEDGTWLVKLQPRQAQGPGYILLSLPDSIPLSAVLAGEPVQPADIQA